MSLRNINTLDPVREGYGIGFTHCNYCNGCGANSSYERIGNNGTTYFFRIMGVQLGTSQVELEIQMDNYPFGCSRNMSVALTHITDRCLACDAFQDSNRKGKAITGYLRFPS